MTVFHFNPNGYFSAPLLVDFFHISESSFFYLERGLACPHFKYFISYQLVCTIQQETSDIFPKSGGSHFLMLRVAVPPLFPHMRSAVRQGLVQPTERVMAKLWCSRDIVVTEYVHLPICVLFCGQHYHPCEEISARQFMVVSGAGAFEDGLPQSIHVMRHHQGGASSLWPFFHHLGDEKNHTFLLQLI